MSVSLQPHEPQHTRPPCPSPTPRAHPNSCPLSQWCHPTILSCRPLLLLPSVFPRIRVFSNESALPISWPKYWSYSFSISPSNEHPGLISFTTDWLDLLAVQGTLKTLLQHHSSKASILQILAESLPEVSWYSVTPSRHRFTVPTHPTMAATLFPRLLSSFHPGMSEPSASPSKAHPPYSLIHSDKVTIT